MLEENFIFFYLKTKSGIKFSVMTGSLSYLLEYHRGAALPTNTPGIPCIFDPQGRAGICGDWLLGFDCCAGGGYCEELVFVADFWWKVGCVGLLEKETKRKREEREIEEKREKKKFILFDCVVYIILMSYI